MKNNINSAQQIITEFRKSKYFINPDGSYDESVKELSEDLTNAVEQLATGLYEKDIHFVMELIQNAEDNNYHQGDKPQLNFVLLNDDPTNTSASDGCLCIFNNEAGFKEENVKSISAIGKSTKKKVDGYIGEKGIGFKSVYIVSASPHIFSNGYQIKFYEKDPDFYLNYIVPYWVNDVPQVVSQFGASTSLLLPLKKNKKQQIINHLADIQPESILFLNKLEELQITVEQNNKEITFKRLVQQNKTYKLDVVSGGVKTSSRYWIYKETVVVPDDLEEEKREGITEREIVIAFPLDKSGLRGKVFSYLPTEADSGFPFLINTDFMLAANRESIQTGRDWNIWLRDVLSDVIVNALQDMQKQTRFKKRVYQYIPLPDMDTHGYFPIISQTVCEKLEKLDFVYSDSKLLLPAIGTRLVASNIRDLFEFKERPDWFSSCSFVDSSINHYSEQLKAIGVCAFATSDLMDCLDDSSWLKKRNQKWFLQLYKYLHDHKKYISDDISNKKVIPCDKNRFFSPDENVFWVSNQGILDNLNKILSIDNLPEIKLLRPGILAKLQANRSLMSWADSYLGVTKLSISSYIQTTILPWMDEKTDLLDSKSVMLMTSFILNQWKVITDEAKDSVWELLPVVLEDESVVRRCKLEGHELLVPRGFDPDTGWQNMLKEPDEYDHSDVLNKAYLRLREDEDTFVEFMKSISAESYPDLKEHSYTSAYGHDDETLSNYLYDIFQSEYSTRGKSLMTWVAPYFLHSSNLLKVAKNRNSLLHWLEEMIENRDFDLKNAKFRWFNYSSKQKHIESYLFHCLRRTSWINTTKGLKKPGEIFVESKSLREIFQNKLPYLKDTISPELCDFLSIKSEATTESILDYLRELSNTKEVDKVLIRKLYEYLNNNGYNFKKSFEENKLIYVPDSKEGWYSINEVIWENAEVAFGDSFAWLSNHYLKLKEFFVDELEVKETVDDQSILDTWLRFQEGNNSKIKIEEFLKFAVPKIVSMIKSGGCEEILEPFFEEGNLWVQSKEWIKPSWEEIYIPDDQKLRNLFKGEKINFPWLAVSTHAEQSLLYERFELPKLSDSVAYEVVKSVDYTVKSEKEILTSHTVQLICEMIVNEDRRVESQFDQQIESGLVSVLYHAEEKEGSHLKVEVSLDGLNKELPEVSAFFDHKQAALFINQEDDIEDIKDDVAESLAREIWKYGYKSYVDTVRTLLAVTNDKRFKKIRESKGWTFSKENREKLKSVYDTPFSFGEPEIILENDKGDLSADDGKSKESSGSGAGGSSTSGWGEIDGSETQETTDYKKGKEQGEKTASGNTGSRHSHGRRTTGTNRRRSTRVRITKTRSENINRRTNTVRRNRMVSYVVNELNETKENGNDIEKARARKKQGEITEKIVFDDLSVKGYEVKQMPEGNKGYDLEAIDPQNGELYYIEVKSDAFQWSEKGVGISLSQYEFAREKGDSFILAVVDNLATKHSNPIYVINPVSHISEYRFDHMWSKVSTNLRTIEIESEENVVQELMSLTGSTRCKELIKFCDEKKYPLPDVGIEISNVDGEVIFEDIELGWEQEKIAVVFEEVDQTILVDSGWEFFIESDEEIESILEEVFRGAD